MEEHSPLGNVSLSYLWSPSPETLTQTLDNQTPLIVTLLDWTIAIDYQDVFVQGYMSNGRFWRSAPVLVHVNNSTVITSKSTCILKGPINQLVALKNGTPHALVDKFLNGFPSQWRSILKDYFKAKVHLTRRLTRHSCHSSNIKPQSKTRSGRTCKPPCRFYEESAAFTREKLTKKLPVSDTDSDNSSSMEPQIQTRSGRISKPTSQFNTDSAAVKRTRLYKKLSDKNSELEDGSQDVQDSVNSEGMKPQTTTRSGRISKPQRQFNEDSTAVTRKRLNKKLQASDTNSKDEHWSQDLDSDNSGCKKKETRTRYGRISKPAHRYHEACRVNLRTNIGSLLSSLSATYENVKEAERTARSTRKVNKEQVRNSGNKPNMLPELSLSEIMRQNDVRPCRIVISPLKPQAETAHIIEGESVLNKAATSKPNKGSSLGITSLDQPETTKNINWSPNTDFLQSMEEFVAKNKITETRKADNRVKKITRRKPKIQNPRTKQGSSNDAKPAKKKTAVVENNPAPVMPTKLAGKGTLKRAQQIRDLISLQQNQSDNYRYEVYTPTSKKIIPFNLTPIALRAHTPDIKTPDLGLTPYRAACTLEPDSESEAPKRITDSAFKRADLEVFRINKGAMKNKKDFGKDSERPQVKTPVLKKSFKTNMKIFQALEANARKFKPDRDSDSSEDEYYSLSEGENGLVF